MSRTSKIILSMLIAFQFAVTFQVNIARLYTNKSVLFDLGVFYQFLYNFITTGYPGSSINYPYAYLDFMGFHFSPILLLLSPLVLIGAWTLLLVQSIFVALSAIPMFYLARKITASQTIALIWAAIFLFNPFVINGAVFDFHEQCVSLFFYCWALYAVADKNWRLLLSMCAVLMFFKEQEGITIAGFGLLWWRLNNDRKGLYLTMAGVAWFLLVMLVIMPFLYNGLHPMLNSTSAGRYSWIADHKWGMIRQLFTDNKTNTIPAYLFMLVAIMLFLPLGGLVWCLPALGDIAANLLSSVPMPRSLLTYHSITIIPCLVAAACITLKNHGHQFRYKPVPLSLIVLMCIALCDFIVSPVAATGDNAWNIDLWHKENYKYAKDPEINEIRAIVGPDTALSVQSNIGVWFADRKYIFQFPDRYKDVDFIIVNLVYPYEHMQRPIGNPYDLDEFAVKFGRLLHDPRFRIIYAKHYWVVFERVGRNQIKH